MTWVLPLNQAVRRVTASLAICRSVFLNAAGTEANAAPTR